MSGRAYLSIGDVLTLLREEFPDVTISKIRFLESQRLINPERSPSGYRKFYEPDVERLRWVLRQQRDHFLPLKVIRDRLAGAGNGVPTDEPQTGHVEAGRPSVAARVATAVAATRLSAEGVGNGATVQLAEPREEVGTGPVTSGPMPSAVGAVGPQEAAPAAPAAPPDNGAVVHAGRSRAHAAPAPTPTPAPMAPDPEGAATPEPEPEAATGTAAGAPATGTEPVEGAGDREPPAEVALAPEAADEPAPAHASPEPPVPSQAHAPAHAAPVEPVEQRQSQAGGSAGGEAPPGRGSSLTLDELCAASGLPAPQIVALESFGLIEPTNVAGAAYYDDDAVTVAKLAAELARYGIEARHLRLYRNAVEREVGLVEQVVAPLLRQRNPAARQRAVDSATDMARVGEELRSVLLRRELRRQLGG